MSRELFSLILCALMLYVATYGGLALSRAVSSPMRRAADEKLGVTLFALCLVAMECMGGALLAWIWTQ